MSWITDIAGRAEELLNKIDKNAAIVLKKDKDEKKSYGKSKKEDDNHFNGDRVNSESEKLTSLMKLSHSSPAITSSPYHQFPDLLDSTINHEDSNLRTRETMEQSCSDKLATLDKSNITEDVRELMNENVMLKNEIRTLNNEVFLLLNRVKESDKDTSNLEEKFNRSEAETVVLNQELNEINSKLTEATYKSQILQLENERFRNLVDDCESSQVLKIQQEISELQLKSQRKEEVLLNNISCLEKRLELNEARLGESEQERKKALEELRVELEQYRSKAQQQAVELDKYRSTLTSQQVGTNMSEDLLSENIRLRDDLEGARLDTRQAVLKIDSARKEISSLQSDLSTYRDRAISAEHAQKNLRQELEVIQRDMSDKVSKLGDDLKKRETELRQAKTELVTRRSQDTWQSRVTNLTSALVRKQAALEQASTESAQLRLQLEKTKSKCSEYSQQLQMLHRNDTDDVKAQGPYMSIDSSNRGITKHMMRIYSFMDSVATRATGLLLRRYPLARIIVLIYLIVLHSIICMVLYMWTPDTK